MRNLLITFLSCAIGQLTFSQDIIVFKNNEKHFVKIEEINSKEIKYRNFGDPEGPLYVVEKNKVISYTLEDGTTVKLNPAFNDTLNLKNIARVNPVDLIPGNLSFSFERMLGEENKFSVYVPFRVGLNTDRSKDPPGKNMFSGGLGFLFYFKEVGRLKLFTGVEIEYSLRNMRINVKAPKPDNYWSPVNGTSGDYIWVYDHDERTHFLSYYFIAGARYSVKPNAGIYTAFGYGQMDNLTSVKSYLAAKAELGVFFAF